MNPIRQPGDPFRHEFTMVFLGHEIGRGHGEVQRVRFHVANLRKPNVGCVNSRNKQRPRRFAAFARMANPHCCQTTGTQPASHVEPKSSTLLVKNESSNNVGRALQRGHRGKPRSHSVRISFNDPIFATINRTQSVSQCPKVAIDLALPHRFCRLG